MGRVDIYRVDSKRDAVCGELPAADLHIQSRNIIFALVPRREDICPAGTSVDSVVDRAHNFYPRCHLLLILE